MMPPDIRGGKLRPDRQINLRIYDFFEIEWSDPTPLRESLSPHRPPSENMYPKMTTAEPSGAAFWLIPTSSEQIEKTVNQAVSSAVSKSKLKNEIKFASDLADPSK